MTPEKKTKPINRVMKDQIKTEAPTPSTATIQSTRLLSFVRNMLEIVTPTLMKMRVEVKRRDSEVFSVGSLW